MSYDVIIVGAGPGGLSCATALASAGMRTLVLERKPTVGPKVCAGGITWNGLIQTIPAELAERRFASQRIVTRLQQVTLTAATPMVATVNREKLGRQMVRSARQAGAEIRPGCRVTTISGDRLTFYDHDRDRHEQPSFRYLVGADGSSSLVRRHLNLPAIARGIGINYQLPGSFPSMEWHLDSRLFRSGYAWIFPHRETVSVGGYVDARVMKASSLRDNLQLWAARAGLPLADQRGQAEYVNFDFRGWRFANIFLVGDAAGLASGLTGEGIYPAIVSGGAVAGAIISPRAAQPEFLQLVRNHRRHRQLVELLGKNRLLSTFLAELITFSLKKGLLDFQAAEMAS